MSEDRDPLKAQKSDVIAKQVALANGETGKDPAQRRKTQRYPSEEKRKGRKATYDLDPAIIAGVKDIATRERMARNQSKVAAALLSYAIAHYEADRFTLDVRQEGPNWWVEAVEK